MHVEVSNEKFLDFIMEVSLVLARSFISWQKEPLGVVDVQLDMEGLNITRDPCGIHVFRSNPLATHQD